MPLFEARRFEPGFDGGRKSFALYRPNGEKGLGDTRRVVYGLRAVRAAAESGRAVLVVEGEKHVDALSRLGLVATTNPMGAGKWRDQYAEHFRGVKRAVVLPDDDQPGREHAAKVAASLATVVPDVRVCEIWPRGETKADVLDWLAYADNEELREQAEGTARRVRAGRAESSRLDRVNHRIRFLPPRERP